VINTAVDTCFNFNAVGQGKACAKLFVDNQCVSQSAAQVNQLLDLVPSPLCFNFALKELFDKKNQSAAKISISRDLTEIQKDGQIAAIAMVVVGVVLMVLSVACCTCAVSTQPKHDGRHVNAADFNRPIQMHHVQTQLEDTTPWVPSVTENQPRAILAPMTDNPPSVVPPVQPVTHFDSVFAAQEAELSLSELRALPPPFIREMDEVPRPVSPFATIS